jgi:hypothetical protein
MQVYFDANFPTQQDYLKKEKLKRHTAASGYLSDIMDARDKTMAGVEGKFLN